MTATRANDIIISCFILKGHFTLNSCEKNFGFKHKCGILMPLSSLPSPYGIGTMGRAAFDFLDFLHECGQSVWQVLPLNPTSYGDSPYQSPASVAGNPYFLDLDILVEKGLLKQAEIDAQKCPSDRVDYGKLFYERYKILRRAYERFTLTDDYIAFCKRGAYWLEDYSLFMALKVHYGYKPWTKWDKEHRDITSARRQRQKFAVECGFWTWLQYEFFSQWRTLCDYAHERGISMIGDMPIYVAHDSMDVWRSPEQFLLDEDYAPTIVAGCPPDAYSETGQLWGNPIYDWALMEKQGFKWWIDRVRQNLELYDLVRIDHFRGFASYYSIPFGDEDAKRGKWNKAPGEELFAAIRAALPDSKIIAEDLGFITEDVRELLAKTDFPGMKVLQFAFYDEDNEYLPRMYETDNCIVYTSSHDSDCTRSWFKNLDKKARARFKRECPRAKGQTATYAAISLAMTSRANLAVISMQDYLELTNEQGRMNIPSVPSGNWEWRIKQNYNTKKLRDKIIRLTAIGDRARDN